MSALLDQLRTLRKQAGAVNATPAERPVLPDDLRKLLGMRLALQKRGYSQDRVLPGVEIAPGVLYLEEFFACEDSPTIINAEFAKFGSIQHARAFEEQLEKIRSRIVTASALLRINLYYNKE